MGDWEEESPSEDEKTEIENQLYSMFYYHSVNDGIPDDLAQKYFIDVNDYGASISLKQPSKDLTGDVNNEVVINGRQDVKNTSKTDSSPDSGQIVNLNCSSDSDLEDFVKLPSEIPHLGRNKSLTTLKNKYKNSSKILSHYASKSQEVLPHRNLGNSRYFSQLNYACSSPGSELRIDCRNKFDKVSNQSRNKLPCSTPLNKNFNSFKNKFDSQKDVFVGDRVKKEKHIIDLTDEPKLKKRRKESVITISDSENEDSDVVICSESESDLSCTESNSADSETTDSDGFLENFGSILLNTSAPERDYCDISLINTDYDWKQTSSPDGWTKSMRKYYNKPSIRRLTFDYDSMIQKIRDEGNADWSICRADILKTRSGRRVRCLRCQQEGHMKANCTKVFSCHMCGTSGHIANKCPSKICLKCGSKHRQGFVDGCHNCTNSASPVCNACGVKGHVAKLCTNAWRSLIQQDNIDSCETDSATKYCCHCGKSGHFYEHCNRLPKHCRQSNLDLTPQSHKRGVKKIRKNMNNGTLKKSRKDSSSQLDQFISVPSSHKKAKFRIRGNFRTKKKHIYHRSIFHDEEQIKKKKIPHRVLMLKNSKKYKNLKKRLSYTI